MMRSVFRASSFFTALLLAGCTSLLPTSSPERSGNTAVVALLEQAQAQSSAGDLEAAGASFERAVRIEPRNPVLWQELARVRINQGLYRQAENLAAKSNALAVNDRRLRSENWRIIGQARHELGDPEGAQSAFKKAGKGG